MIAGEDRYARLAAQVLKAQSAEAQPEASGGRRDHVVAAMALAIAGKRRRRRTVIAVGVVFAAAAALLLMVKVTGPKHAPTGPGTETALTVQENTGSGNSLVRNAVQKPLLDGAHLVEGDSIQAVQDGSTTLGFANGTRVTLSAAGRLRVDELAATRRFSLHSGHLQAHVAKLGQGERFLVDTPDAEVEVRGTVFGVSVDAAGDCHALAARSTVSVNEGAVWVHAGANQVLLKPGESWTSPCPDAPVAPAETRPTVTATGGTHAALPSARPAARHLAAPPPRGAPVMDEASVAPPPPVAFPPPVAPPAAEVPVRRESHLAEQNNLFSSAIVLEHQGDHAAALRKLDELIKRFPSGPLLESARAERQRILSVQSPR